MSEQAAVIGGRACLSVQFKPSIRSKHQDRRRTEWVFRGEEDAKMVESSLKLCAGGTADGTVPFLGFGDKDTSEEDKVCVCYSRICHPEIKQVNVCRGGWGRRGRPRAVRQCNR